MSLSPRLFEALRHVCLRAWQRGLLSGFNGNVSVRLDGGCCCVSRSGAAKGDLQPEDLVLVDISSGQSLEGLAPSSELPMHLEVYRALPQVTALVHTHPRHLLALELRLRAQKPQKVGGQNAAACQDEEAWPDDAGWGPDDTAWQEEFLRLELFEAAAQRQRLGFAPPFPPGSAALAAAVCAAQREHEAVWLSRHGLLCRAHSPAGPHPCTVEALSAALSAALGLSEELDHLAAVHLLASPGRGERL